MPAYCNEPVCPVGVPHEHVTDESRVLITIDPAMVESGLWNSDRHAQYAIAMDSDRGDIVWHRSADWRTYGMHNGWNRVARIYPEMPCDGPDHDRC